MFEVVELLFERFCVELFVDGEGLLDLWVNATAPAINMIATATIATNVDLATIYLLSIKSIQGQWEVYSD